MDLLPAILTQLAGGAFAFSAATLLLGLWREGRSRPERPGNGTAEPGAWEPTASRPRFPSGSCR